MLGTTAETLLEWRRRFGFPPASRSRMGKEIYAHEDIVALYDALRDECSVSLAIRRARG